MLTNASRWIVLNQKCHDLCLPVYQKSLSKVCSFVQCTFQETNNYLYAVQDSERIWLKSLPDKSNIGWNKRRIWYISLQVQITLNQHRCVLPPKIESMSWCSLSWHQAIAAGTNLIWMQKTKTEKEKKRKKGNRNVIIHLHCINTINWNKTAELQHSYSYRMGGEQEIYFLVFVFVFDMVVESHGLDKAV